MYIQDVLVFLHVQSEQVVMDKPKSHHPGDLTCRLGHHKQFCRRLSFQILSGVQRGAEERVLFILKEYKENLLVQKIQKYENYSNHRVAYLSKLERD